MLSRPQHMLIRTELGRSITIKGLFLTFPTFLGATESSDKFVPNLDMYVWDQTKPRRYNEPAGGNESSLNHSG